MNGGDIVEAGVERGGHILVGGGRVSAERDLDHPRVVAVAAEQVEQVGFGNAGQDGGIGDLVAVEVQDGQDRAVAGGIEKLVGVPAGGQRAGLGFSVADHAEHRELGVVERGAVGVQE